MKTRQLGSTGLRVSVVGMGTMSWPGCNYRERAGAQTTILAGTCARETVKAALDAGVTLFDTAESYGCGLAEQVLGAALRESGRRSEVAVVTKVGPVFGNDADVAGRGCVLTADHILRRCEASLIRLRTEVIDLYLAHRPDPFTQIQETVDAFTELKRRGWIRHFGFSNYHGDELSAAMGSLGATAIQEVYNLLERGIEHQVCPDCIKAGVAVIAYSPLGKGMLTGKYSAQHLPPADDYRRHQPHFTRANLPRHLAIAERVRCVARDLGLTPVQLAVGWCIAQPGITAAIAGAKSAAQIAETAGAGSVELPEWALIDLTRSDEK